ncbi:MAG: hypothetical protein LQ340_003953 [Diploschistes diacapsis]|nr:MAG: hypothetical protein LQ340_003953 [Diploschistes diacapsis]
MSDAPSLNANPTIRPLSELPTRRRQPTPIHDDEGPEYAPLNVMPKPCWLSDPFDPPSPPSPSSSASEEYEPIDEQEIYDLISTISDPEHPLSLGSLAVVNLPDIHIKPLGKKLQVVTVEITPTVAHCSMAILIGLGVRVRLERSLPARFRVDVRVKEGSLDTADRDNKQLGDKERVVAALENEKIMGWLRKMMETCL